MQLDETMLDCLKVVNELIPGATPAGAYSLGFAISAGSSGRWLPTRSQMEELTRCTTAQEGEALVSRLAASNTLKKKEGTE